MSRRKKNATQEEREASLRVKRKLHKIAKHPVSKMLTAHSHNRYLFGYRVQQNMASIWVLEAMLSSYRPDVIVELGTGFGMLTTYFSVYGMLSDFDVDITTIDLMPPKLKDKISDINDGKTNCLQKDIYAPETVELVASKVNNAKRPFVLVDGKDPKSNEVNLYAPEFKEGVIMFAHDASLDNARRVRWGFKESKINWDYVERCEPYYSWSVQGDTRMLCMRTKKKLKKS